MTEPATPTGVEAELARVALRRYLKLDAAITRLKAAKAQEERTLVELAGDSQGVAGSFGQFICPEVAGRVGWQRIAQELSFHPCCETGCCGAPVPPSLIAKHRGPSYRYVTTATLEPKP